MRKKIECFVCHKTKGAMFLMKELKAYLCNYHYLGQKVREEIAKAKRNEAN